MNDAWAAGLFEGEGSIIVSASKTGRLSLRLQLAMQDREPVERWAEWARIRKVNAWTTSAGKVRYTAQINGARAVQLFEKMRPWLCTRRVERFEELHTLWLSQASDRRRAGGGGAACGYTRPRSSAGYERHRKRGERSCRECLDARRDGRSDR